jgi:hypothetical protein
MKLDMVRAILHGSKKSSAWGHRIWQIAFGSRFKCNSAVWEALRNVKHSQSNSWLDCIDRYPIEIVDGIPSHKQLRDQKWIRLVRTKGKGNNFKLLKIQ